MEKKVMTKLFNKIKKPYFWPIFGSFSPILGGNEFFQKNLSLSHTSYMFLTPCQNLEKIKDPIQRKRLYRHTNGRTDRDDRRTLFYRTLSDTAEYPIKK